MLGSQNPQEIPTRGCNVRDRLQRLGSFSGGSDSKGPPAMEETQVQSLGQEDLLEKGMATHSSIPAWRIPRTREAWGATIHGVARSRTCLSD